MLDFWARWNGNDFCQKTIVFNGFAMVFGPATFGHDGFSMVSSGTDHWSNDGMVAIHRYGLMGNLITFMDKDTKRLKENRIKFNQKSRPGHIYGLVFSCWLANKKL